MYMENIFFKLVEAFEEKIYYFTVHSSSFELKNERELLDLYTVFHAPHLRSKSSPLIST
mgnify:CR=1 FL=1